MIFSHWAAEGALGSGDSEGSIDLWWHYIHDIQGNLSLALCPVPQDTAVLKPHTLSAMRAALSNRTSCFLPGHENTTQLSENWMYWECVPEKITVAKINLHQRWEGNLNLWSRPCTDNSPVMSHTLYICHFLLDHVALLSVPQLDCFCHWGELKK